MVRRTRDQGSKKGGKRKGWNKRIERKSGNRTFINEKISKSWKEQGGMKGIAKKKELRFATYSHKLLTINALCVTNLY